MTAYEYKVIPAPRRGEKAKGVKGAEARFAHAIEQVMNRMAQDGWEFQRAELLPSDERSGLTGQTTAWRNLLVFRRPAQSGLAAFHPEPLAQAATPEPAPEPAPARAAVAVAARDPFDRPMQDAARPRLLVNRAETAETAATRAPSPAVAVPKRANAATETDIEDEEEPDIQETLRGLSPALRARAQARFRSEAQSRPAPQPSGPDPNSDGS